LRDRRRSPAGPDRMQRADLPLGATR
jgi:hypothetical protein